jgi:lysophospholipase L1-like esterase
MKKYVSTKRFFSLLSIAPGMLLILIFMAAMKSPSTHAKSYTYLALGDSYTIGEQVADQDNFPAQAVQMLGNEGVLVQAPKIIAKTGWTTDELQADINKAHITENYDFVTLLIGVNNQYRGRSVIEYAKEFEALLKQAIGFAGNNTTHVIVLSIPDWGATPFGATRDRNQITHEIDNYNATNKLIAEKYKVRYIDITPGTRDALQDLSLLTTDGLHPSAKEYARWAKKVAGVIKESL